MHGLSLSDQARLIRKDEIVGKMSKNKVERKNISKYFSVPALRWTGGSLPLSQY
jgi:hypothetical protein